MSYKLTNGIVVVSLEPEYDYKLATNKIEDVSRARDGTAYKYPWGTFTVVKFTANYVTSADMCTINSWWGANTLLSLIDDNGTTVASGALFGDVAPVTQLIKPYNDQYTAVIDLEST